jgi:hypothetical protein
LEVGVVMMWWSKESVMHDRGVGEGTKHLAISIDSAVDQEKNSGDNGKNPEVDAVYLRTSVSLPQLLRNGVIVTYIPSQPAF